MASSNYLEKQTNITCDHEETDLTKEGLNDCQGDQISVTEPNYVSSQVQEETTDGEKISQIETHDKAITDKEISPSSEKKMTMHGENDDSSTNRNSKSTESMHTSEMEDPVPKEMVDYRPVLKSTVFVVYQTGVIKWSAVISAKSGSISSV